MFARKSADNDKVERRASARPLQLLVRRDYLLSFLLNLTDFLYGFSCGYEQPLKLFDDLGSTGKLLQVIGQIIPHNTTYFILKVSCR